MNIYRRPFRGGAWAIGAYMTRICNRGYNYLDLLVEYNGVRVVRRGKYD